MDDHRIIIENRKNVHITDLLEIDSFIEEEIKATLNEGGVIIKGKGLNIRRLDLQEGVAEIEGFIDSIMYIKAKEKRDKNIMTRILK